MRIRIALLVYFTASATAAITAGVDLAPAPIHAAEASAVREDDDEGRPRGYADFGAGRKPNPQPKPQWQNPLTSFCKLFTGEKKKQEEAETALLAAQRARDARQIAAAQAKLKAANNAAKKKLDDDLRDKTEDTAYLVGNFSQKLMDAEKIMDKYGYRYGYPRRQPLPPGLESTYTRLTAKRPVPPLEYFADVDKIKSLSFDIEEYTPKELKHREDEDATEWDKYLFEPLTRPLRSAWNCAGAQGEEDLAKRIKDILKDRFQPKLEELQKNLYLRQLTRAQMVGRQSFSQSLEWQQKRWELQVLSEAEAPNLSWINWQNKTIKAGAIRKANADYTGDALKKREYYADVFKFFVKVLQTALEMEHYLASTEAAGTAIQRKEHYREQQIKAHKVKKEDEDAHTGNPMAMNETAWKDLENYAGNILLTAENHEIPFPLGALILSVRNPHGGHDKDNTAISDLVTYGLAYVDNFANVTTRDVVIKDPHSLAVKKTYIGVKSVKATGNRMDKNRARTDQYEIKDPNSKT